MDRWTEHQVARQLDGLRRSQDRLAATWTVADLGAPGAARPDTLPSLTVKDEAAFAELIDPDQVRVAQRFFSTFGFQIGAALLYRALPECYAAARGAQVLYLTGELVSSPERRVRETMQFLLEVMSPDPTIADGGLRQKTTLHPGHRAAEAARRMRWFHQSVRNFIASPSVQPRWKGRREYFPQVQPSGPELGEPLNQEDLLGTLLEFTAGVFETLGVLGVPYTEGEKAAWFHVWDVVGRYLGIGTASAVDGEAGGIEISGQVAPFLPLDPVHAHEMLAVIRRRQFMASFEGKLLTNALLAVLHHPLSRGVKPLPAALMRYLLGAETADLLGIARGGWFHEWLMSAETWPRIAKAIRSSRPGGAVRATAGELSSFMTYLLLQEFLDAQGHGRRFDVPAPLRRSRGLNQLTPLERRELEPLEVTIAQR